MNIIIGLLSLSIGFSSGFGSSDEDKARVTTLVPESSNITDIGARGTILNKITFMPASAFFDTSGEGEIFNVNNPFTQVIWVDHGNNLNASNLDSPFVFGGTQVLFEDTQIDGVFYSKGASIRAGFGYKTFEDISDSNNTELYHLVEIFIDNQMIGWAMLDTPSLDFPEDHDILKEATLPPPTFLPSGSINDVADPVIGPTYANMKHDAPIATLEPHQTDFCANIDDRIMV